MELKIREWRPEDIEQIRKIHTQFYQVEFDFPDFSSNFIGAFVVHSGDSIVCVGGVRNIAESIVLTDMNHNVKDRRIALLQVLHASEFITRQSGHNELHAFVQDEVWYKQLVKVGFLPTKGKPLVLEL